MAAKSSIAMMREAALNRIEAALDGFTMPRQGNDPDMLYVRQLEAIAEHLEAQREPVVENGLTAMIELKPVTVKASKKK